MGGVRGGHETNWRSVRDRTSDMPITTINQFHASRCVLRTLTCGVPTHIGTQRQPLAAYFNEACYLLSQCLGRVQRERGMKCSQN